MLTKLPGRLFRRTMHSLLLGFSLATILMTTTAPSAFAIPSEGDYEWDSGPTITGTFHSNGIDQLTTWNFIVSGITFTEPLNNNGIDENTASLFRQTDGQLTYSISWYPGTYGNVQVCDITVCDQPVLVGFSRVPEPTTALQLALGLGLLAGVRYGMRQRQSAGLQIG
ncbi:MAG: hypothetical protein OEY86_00570 [Nitrospira sp.]|nr:hypothetical protein [Nitrospira sp.]